MEKVVTYDLDLRDKKLLFELDKNSRLSLSELAKKLKTSKEVVHYRINNLIKNKIILKFQAVPASYRFGQIGYKVYIRLGDCSEQEFKKIEEFLLNQKDCFYLAVCKGRWDLIFGLWGKNLEDFFKVHDLFMNKFSKYIQEKELSIGRETIQFNRRWMYSDNSPVSVFTWGEKESKINLERKDQKILDLLVADSRKSMVDISKETDISVYSVRYRIKAMEKEGIIKGYKCLLNSSKVGFTTCKAFIFFKSIHEEKMKEFIEYCKNLQNTINIVITFAPWDLEIMFETKSYEEYFRIMDDIKERFKDIIHFYESVLITSEKKQVLMAKR